MIKFQPFPILETTHLRLIELSYNHLDELFLMRNNRMMHEFTDTKPDNSIEETRIYIQKMIMGVADNKWIIWAIEHKLTKKIIGTISIWNIDNNSAELGYGLIPEYQAQGLMQETLIKIVDYGFSILGLTNLDAYTEVSNTRSIKLLEKCSFRFIKETIDKGYVNNRDYSMMCYRIQSEEEKVMRNCSWPGSNNLMRKYHDEEWCVPSHDDRFIFEMLNLEGAQAGLSWSTVINKRDQYLLAFHNFDIHYCASLTEDDFEYIRLNFGIIKNRLKIKAVRTNALLAIEIQKEYGSLANYFWSFANHTPIINQWNSETHMPAESDISQKISNDLKKRGFKFVGSVIMYSFMQAIGMVDDHIIECSYHTKNRP